jgi:hypothetical protein
MRRVLSSMEARTLVIRALCGLQCIRASWMLVCVTGGRLMSVSWTRALLVMQL